MCFLPIFQGKAKASFFKQAKKAYPMFPFHEEKIKWDEYGEIIRYLSLTYFMLCCILVTLLGLINGASDQCHQMI